MKIKQREEVRTRDSEEKRLEEEQEQNLRKICDRIVRRRPKEEELSKRLWIRDLKAERLLDTII